MPSNTNSQGQSKGGFWAALASAGAGLVTGLGNIFSGKKRDERQQKWANSMYEKQKADEIAFWEKNNMYNSPQAQMQRLKEAGLNPNLVYGNGAVANSSSSPNVPNAPNVQFQPREFTFDAASHLMNYYDIRSKTAQLDLLTEQQNVLKQDAILKAVQAANVAQNTEGSKFDLKQKQDLNSTTIEMAKENLRKLTSDISLSQRSAQREDIRLESDLKDAIVKRAYTKAQTTNTITDTARINAVIKQIETSTKMQEIENELAEQGIFRNDPAYMRILNGMAQELTAVNTGYKAVDAVLNTILKGIKGTRKGNKQVTTFKKGNITRTTTINK